MADKIIDYEAIGQKIRDKRIALGLSQDTASEKMGLSESFYGHLERGSRIMSLESLVKIARHLDMSTDYLLMDSIKGDTKNKPDKLQREFENVFKGKTSRQTEYLLSILKVLSENIDRVKP